MDTLFPGPSDASDGVDESDVERLYAYPDALARPWVRVNFVSSTDGAVTVSGKSHGLSSPADKRLFAMIRDLADVILVGSGTALVEGYRGVRPSEVRDDRRARHGLSPLPPIAVVTRHCSVAPDSGLITDTAAQPIVITCAAAPKTRRNALAEAGADVVLAGSDDVDLRTALTALADRGLLRIACEGGPRLFGTLIADDLVDELCLSMAPLLAGGDAGRIGDGALPAAPRELRLASVLADDDMLFLRYLRKSRG